MVLYINDKKDSLNADGRSNEIRPLSIEIFRKLTEMGKILHA